MNEEAGPIFRQVAAEIENAIVDGSLAEESQAPSSNELAAFHRINPATAGKGLNLLADAGVLVKRRGVGMFVAVGAPALLRQRRRDDFARDYLAPLLREAAHLGIDHREITEMMEALQ